MKIAVCEDEPLFADKLSAAVGDFAKAKGEELSSVLFAGFKEAEAGLSSDNFDIIFLDINLGGSLDGVELCRRLRAGGCDVPVVFVTSLENRAVDGYDVEAFGFVVKKQLPERLPVVMERYWREYRCFDALTVTEKNGVIKLPARDIIRVEADRRASLVHTKNGDYTDIRPIGKLSEELGADFIEVFRSVFVNIDHIKSINADTVTMSDDTVIPLSRRHRKNVVNAVMDNVSKGRAK